MAQDLVNTLADLKEQEAIKIVKDRLSAGEDPLKILGDARKGMEIVGKRFASSEYFIPDLVYSGEILKIVTDIPAQKFVDKIKETGAPVVGLSGFLTLAFDSMKETVEAIKAAGLRDKVKVMIGGGQMSDEIKNYTGADAYGKDAMAGVSLAKKWIGAS